MNDWSGQQLGNYRLTHRLGKGGFAEVYLGEHVFLGILAAIKVLHQEHMLPEEQPDVWQKESATYRSQSRPQ